MVYRCIRYEVPWSTMCIGVQGEDNNNGQLWWQLQSQMTIHHHLGNDNIAQMTHTYQEYHILCMYIHSPIVCVVLALDS